MKHTLSLLLSTALLLLGSCQSDEPAAPQPSGMGSITFDVINYEQYAFDDVTRASSTDTLDNLDMAIYDMTADTLVYYEPQKKKDKDYGSFSATLPYGDYNVVFLGYQGERKAKVDSPTNIYFENDFVPDFFYKSTSISIAKTQKNTQSISLERAVAAFDLISIGKIPANLNYISITTNDGSHHFNALKGLADKTEKRTQLIKSVKKLFAGKDSLSVNYYTFLTSNESKMSFSVTAYDTLENEIRTHVFEDAPMKINRRTRFTGDFFAEPRGKQGFTLSDKKQEWKDTLNVTY